MLLLYRTPCHRPRATCTGVTALRLIGLRCPPSPSPPITFHPSATSSWPDYVDCDGHETSTTLYRTITHEGRTQLNALTECLGLYVASEHWPQPKPNGSAHSTLQKFGLYRGRYRSCPGRLGMSTAQFSTASAPCVLVSRSPVDSFVGLPHVLTSIGSLRPYIISFPKRTSIYSGQCSTSVNPSLAPIHKDIRETPIRFFPPGLILVYIW